MTLPTLARYEFVSVFRRGAAASLPGADALSGSLPARGRLTVNVQLRSSAGAETVDDTPATAADLYGPGDVVGFDPRQVVRTEPRAGTADYESNYLAAIDFDHPELPWLFTPAAAAGDKLRPWLALIVCAASEFQHAPGAPDPLPVVEVAAGAALPDLDDSWAWAHAQVSGGIPAGESVGALQRSDPHRVSSRLLSPRRLRPETRYTAFLVPAFELGVKAGLGEAVPTGATAETAPAWAAGAAARLPYYYSFEFGTAPSGDFETLVRGLVPRRLPPEVGMRPMDVDRPGWGLPSAGAPLGLAGALRTVDAEDTVWEDPERSAFQTAIGAEVNRAAAPLDGEEEPVVTLPIYGRWHAARTTIDPAAAGWLDVLNADPRNRASAGFGTRVVLDQRNQLMHSAWEQVDGILRANQILRQAQLARSASELLYAKHLAGGGAATLLTMTKPLHARLLASPRTVKATLAAGALPSGALAPAFRRVARARGPLRRRQGARGRGPAELWRRLNQRELTPAPRPRRPDGLIALGESASGATASPLSLGTGALPWLVPLAILLALLALFLLGWVGALVVAVLVAALVALALLGRAVASRGGAVPDPVGGGLTEADLTPAAFAEAPTRPEFTIVPPGISQPAGNRPGAPGPDSAAAAAFRAAAVDLAEWIAIPDPAPYPERPAVAFEALAATVLDRLRPELTIPKRIGGVIELVPRLPRVHCDLENLEEVMAYPEFPQPMYRPLAELSQDYILPGLDLVPRNTLGILRENRGFIESYMVGLDHELARRLLWNGYPTDQRGSYFRQFWDVSCYVPKAGDPSDPEDLAELLKDIREIHTWGAPTALGEHPMRPPPPGGRLILLVRGELFRRYPNTVLYACKAIWDPSEGRHDIPEVEEHAEPVFRGTLEPDVTFFGFDLSAKQARGKSDHGDPEQGWFFVFQQQPAEPRFGLEPAPDGAFSHPPMKEWNDLSWAHMAADEAGLEALEQLRPAAMFGGANPPAVLAEGTNPQDPFNHWADDSAQIAYALLRRPVRIAVHARMMLPEEA